MVVAPLTLTCLSLATLFVAVLPVVLYRRLRKPFALNHRDTIAGIAVFALFAMVIERAVNGYFLQQNDRTSEWLANPFAFVVYGAIVAGLCEEVGRFVAMKLMLNRARRDLDGEADTRVGKRPRVPTMIEGDGAALGYGIGHGGAEAWLIGVFVQLQWIVFAIYDNLGELEAHLGNLPADTMMRLHFQLASLTPQLAGIFVLERVSALVFQIGLSVLMWRGVRAGWRWVLPVAIVAHALVDAPAAMYQAGLLPLIVVDGVYVLAAVAVAGVLVRQMRRPAQAA
ncbi:YhfC family intramembrane metalloprotease [Paraburkholderia sp.]|uniref:YhfC family intramembrane metalloprotease n=1 Tax=Paraburkholderia sp. TaxID=1926495 RepID=UPI0023A50147|nr:YhfC family intramembrane metalloprotease [Paraburkholderia sp.]MDE1184190.1 YhfC family intramembrane metalloprotease [Paraburkholderia sp.]